MENERFDYILNYSSNIPKKTKKILKDIVENHNTSWYEDVYNRNKNNLDNIAIFYRGTKVTYKELFENVNKFAKSLANLDCKRNGKIQEIPICMANCPEFIYLILAANRLGIKINVFNDEFDPDYIKEIINSSNSKLLFATDNMYQNLSKTTNNIDLDKIILFSLTDSLPNHEDPYIEIDKEFYDFKNKVPMYKQNDNRIISNDEFIQSGINYDKEIVDEGSLDDDFIISYTSGSTNTTRPKAMIHRNSSLITIARFHDKDASNLPSIKNFTTLAQIPTHSNTDVITSISDTLSMKCTVALEPIYNEHFFLKSMLINKPNYGLATRCFWLTAFKELMNNQSYSNVRLPFLMMPTAVGEPLTPNEEKFCNKMLRKTKAGTELIPIPITSMSIGGGDCEHGGLFFTFYKSLKEKLPHIALDKKGLGLEPFKMVDCAIIDKNGNRCKKNTLGKLVANSPCTMKEYKDNEEATNEFFITDAEGNKWGDCKVHAYIDKHNTVHMKGRLGNDIILSDGMTIPVFKISDKILKDTKNILSCEVNYLKENDKIVVDIECQPHIKSNSKILSSIDSANKRCIKTFPVELTDKIVYRLRNNVRPFPLTGCGKRNNLKLKNEGINNTFRITDYVEQEKLAEKVM